MDKYELTLVLSGKSKAKEKTVKEKVEKLIKSVQGKVEKTDTWGEIELAYKIKGETSGFFVYFDLELDRSAVKALNEKLRMQEEFIRYLLVKVD
jgi:small subunit ribosomal protein S6